MEKDSEGNDNKKKVSKKKIKQLVKVGKEFWFVALLSLANAFFDKFFDHNDKVIYIISIALLCLLGITIIIFIILGIKNRAKTTDYELLGITKQNGIVNLQDNFNVDYRKVSEKVSTAKKSIKIIAYYADMVIGSLNQHLLKSINNKKNNKVDVQIIVAKKGTPFLDNVSAFEPGPIPVTDTKNAIAKISEEILPTSKGTINYCECNTEIRYALILVDDEWAWWTPYHISKRTEDLISFELTEADEKSLIQLCIDSFTALWEKYAKQNQ